MLTISRSLEKVGTFKRAH